MKIFIGVFCILGMVAIYLFTGKETEAATPNGCTVFGTVGNVQVARCVDPETSVVLYANSNGWMEKEQD